MTTYQSSTILVADDESEIRDILKILLTGEGFNIVLAHDGAEAVNLLDEHIDLIILDINMPKKSGFIAASEIRQKSLAPILFLTAYTGESDKTMGFSAGGDDYLTKPFSNSELLLKVKALLRRYRIYQPTITPKTTFISIRDLSIDTSTETVLKHSEPIILTYTEYKILELLMTHHKQIFSIDHIFNSIWTEDAVEDNTVMVHIKNLRRKIETDSKKPQYIKTAWGKGYYID